MSSSDMHMRDKIASIQKYIQSEFEESEWESRVLNIVKNTDCDWLDLPEVICVVEELFAIFTKTYIPDLTVYDYCHNIWINIIDAMLDTISSVDLSK